MSVVPSNAFLTEADLSLSSLGFAASDVKRQATATKDEHSSRDHWRWVLRFVRL
jgi:hypothetical protein